MTIHLPEDIQRSIEAAVAGGRFASVDDALTEAARLLLRTLAQEDKHDLPAPSRTASPVDPCLGLMRDDVELMDEIVADAYRRRRADN